MIKLFAVVMIFIITLTGCSVVNPIEPSFSAASNSAPSVDTSSEDIVWSHLEADFLGISFDHPENWVKDWLFETNMTSKGLYPDITFGIDNVGKVRMTLLYEESAFGQLESEGVLDVFVEYAIAYNSFAEREYDDDATYSVKVEKIGKIYR